MADAGQFLLERVANHDKHDLKSLGEFNAKHFMDITKVMIDFASSVVEEFANGINKGEAVDVNGKTYSLKKSKSKKEK